MKVGNWEFLEIKKPESNILKYWTRKEIKTNSEVIRVSMNDKSKFVVFYTKPQLEIGDKDYLIIKLFATLEGARLWSDLKLKEAGYEFCFKGGL